MSHEIERFTRSRYTVNIEDGEVRAWPYSRSGRTYRVAAVYVEVTHAIEGPKLSAPKLRGPQVKKDGGDGQQWADERIYAYADDMPDWLPPVLEEIRSDAASLIRQPHPSPTHQPTEETPA